MASQLYDWGMTGLLTGEIDWDTDDFYVALIDTSVYVCDLQNDRYLDDVLAPGFGAGVVSTSDILTGHAMGTGANVGYAFADFCTFSAVSGAVCSALVVYKDTGSSATSPLLCYIDTGVGLPITPSGADIQIDWYDTGSGTSVFFADVTPLPPAYVTLDEAIMAALPEMYFKFDEASGTPADSSGNAHSVTLTGTPTYSAASLDQSGGGSSIDWSGQWLDTDLSMNGWTAFAWEGLFRVDSAAYKSVVSDGADTQLISFRNNATWSVTLKGASVASATPHMLVRPGTGLYVHLAITYDGVDLKTYVNGFQALSVASTGGLTATETHIFRRSAGNTEYYDGLASHMAFYDHILTPDQILIHAALALNGSEPEH